MVGNAEQGTFVARPNLGIVAGEAGGRSTLSGDADERGSVLAVQISGCSLPGYNPGYLVRTRDGCWRFHSADKVQRYRNFDFSVPLLIAETANFMGGIIFNNSAELSIGRSLSFPFRPRTARRKQPLNSICAPDQY